MFLDNVEDSCLVEVGNPKVDFSSVAEIVAPWKERINIGANLSNPIQVFRQPLLCRQLSSIRKMIDKLMRLHPVMV